MNAISPRWRPGGRTRAAQQSRQERIEIRLLHGALWDPERVLSVMNCCTKRVSSTNLIDVHVVYDPQPHALAPRSTHRRILATALGRLRGKIKYRPVVFELLPPTFTLWQLQRVVESLAGKPLHKQNFRRLLERGGLVEGTGQYDLSTGGRPAELFRFRRDVLRERAAPGVGLPGLSVGT